MDGQYQTKGWHETPNVLVCSTDDNNFLETEHEIRTIKSKQTQCLGSFADDSWMF